MDLQRAMQWFGVYQGAIDGSFGKGTRAAMADWQGRNGFEPTGVLTTAQRAALTGAWTREREELGLTSLTEPEAGITIDLPLGLVEFEGYQPPFVSFKDRTGAGWQVLLISRKGDQKTLVQLFDRVQALAAIPMDGERTLAKSSFTVTGEGMGTTAFAEARLEGGFIKGFALIAPTADETRRVRVLEAMRASFAATGTVALDENLGEPSSTSAADLTSGLDIRRPAISRSGVFVDAQGSVLTTTEVLDGCTRITLDGRTEATVAIEDATLGFAVLTPATSLAPRAFAEIAPALPRLDSDVAMAGYSYGDKLSAPAVTSGSFSEGQGLNGEPELARLTMATLPGDTGGAVLDGSGAMIGMLAPRTDRDGRDLPRDVSFILQARAIAAALTPPEGSAAPAVTLTPSARSGTLAAEDLSQRARDMTVRVDCWR
jgi:S1-C subfamily serine protease